MRGGEPPCFNLPVESGARVLLGLGSNLGDREAMLERALGCIGAFATVEQRSAVYETAPVGFAGQPDFLNMVARARTELAPLDLLRALKQVEAELGRTPTFRNGPRAIDIDILAYDDIVLHTPELDIPHPRLHERGFVLHPLLEVAPEFRHPERHEHIRDLIAALPASTNVMTRTGAGDA